MSRLLAALLVLTTLPASAAEPAHGHGKSPDHRRPIVMNAEEAAHIRLEMRLFLSGVHKIVTGAAHNDMKMVAEAAESVGMAAAHDVPPALREKLPLEFKKLGHATHSGFDELARDAAGIADPNLALRQLGELMSNCVSCHATFRIEPAGKTR